MPPLPVLNPVPDPLVAVPELVRDTDPVPFPELLETTTGPLVDPLLLTVPGPVSIAAPHAIVATACAVQVRGTNTPSAQASSGPQLAHAENAESSPVAEQVVRRVMQ